MKLPHPLIREAILLAAIVAVAIGWALDHKRLARENLNLSGNLQALRTASEQRRLSAEIMRANAALRPRANEADKPPNSAEAATENNAMP